MKQMFWNNDQFFASLRYFFVKTSKHYKVDLKHTVTMPTKILCDIYT